MGMRALASFPTARSASFILDAAINAPKDDSQYEFAAWLSINDLADVWTEAVLAGKWKIEGREKQLEFALDALDAARSGPVIAALLKERPITRDGAGPWIELIGKGGGKAELAQLYTHVAKGELEPPALARALNALAARAKKDGDPVAGEAMYRRMASACTTCHAIGGAGGKLGPDLTSIGASAPADYIIESILNPAAKVKEGYHAFSFAMKDGSEAIGIPSRETAQEQLIRTVAGELGLPKANIVSKKIAEGGASLMPAGLTAAWTDRERLNLYAFLMELGRPGPFDASKNNVARSWQLTDHIAMKESLELKQNPSAPSGSGGVVEIPVYTLVDGRLTKDLLAEKLAVLQTKNPTVHLTARFQAATAGKAKLNLTGIRKAWLDGQPLAIASEPSPSVELTAGAHTFTVEVDAKSPPEVLRLESPAVSFLGD